MKEVTGDIWSYPARIRCITTNGDINKAGLAVMGRGVALQATQRWPHIRKTLATYLLADGNKVHNLGAFSVGSGDILIYSFPVKHHWHEKADVSLIVQSAQELVEIVGSYSDPIVLPKPGCGNGQLDWIMVKPWIEDILDDRFHVIDYA